jgi:hypothetical protein
MPERIVPGTHRPRGRRTIGKDRPFFWLVVPEVGRSAAGHIPERLVSRAGGVGARPDAGTS